MVPGTRSTASWNLTPVVALFVVAESGVEVSLSLLSRDKAGMG